MIILACITNYVSAAEMLPPINPDEAKVIQQIIAIEGYQAEVTPVHGWARDGMKRSLTDIGIDTKGLKTWQIEVKKDPRPHRGGFFACAYDDDGHVLALSGNGPWLCNESLRALKAMPELRSIRWDHNGFVGNHPEVDLYDGTGFDALAESKLQDIKIGLGFNDKGMEQVAKIKGLRYFSVAHSRTTAEGIKFFEKHPNLESLSVGEMANGRVAEAALASIAKLPKLTRIGFHEAVVSYDNGLKFLAPLKGKLKELDLSMSLVSEADLEKVKGDHLDVKVTTLPAPEIVKRHRFIAQNLAKSAPLELASELKAALAANESQP